MHTSNSLHTWQFDMCTQPVRSVGQRLGWLVEPGGTSLKHGWQHCAVVQGAGVARNGTVEKEAVPRSLVLVVAQLSCTNGCIMGLRGRFNGGGRGGSTSLVCAYVMKALACHLPKKRQEFLLLNHARLGVESIWHLHGVYRCAQWTVACWWTCNMQAIMACQQPGCR
jgi:hypothetical protein